MERIELAAGYNISRVIKGSWQLGGGHGAVDPNEAMRTMRAYVEAGITTFDCADIYAGVEALIGRFLRAERDAIRRGDLAPVQVHTKCVPDLDDLPNLRKSDIVAIIDRSLERLGVGALDLVQLHWWDYEIPGYLEAAEWLERQRQAGKIRHVGLTNFDAAHVGEILDAGIPIVANQVQYSALDHRPEHELASACLERDVSLLCYGTVAGGLLSERYRGAPSPETPYENRSLTKYALIVEEFGGWSAFRQQLEVLSAVAERHGVGIAMVASRYVLQQRAVAGVIVGTRSERHLAESAGLTDFALSTEDIEAIRSVAARSLGPTGPVYGLERIPGGRHAAIMKMNLHRGNGRPPA
jgi:aryl-alcohol dehydrogenase-like predicted oxidoreductase